MAKVIRLTENQFGEMMAYHGSNSNFDKFNHKKYLNSGVGSQVFGWGTYITSDEAIARSYARSSINIHKHLDEIPDILSNLYGLTNDECCDVLEKFYKFTNGFNIPVIDLNKEVKKEDIICYAGREYMNYLDMFVTIINYCRTEGERENTLYEVDIPDYIGDGDNYLSWYDEITKSDKEKIRKGMEIISKRFNFEIPQKIVSYTDRMASVDGSDIYNLLKSILGSAKAASLFLMQCGYDGICYPAGTKWKKPNGASEDAMNYVIFDANKVKIINKTKV